ncbi:MAG: RimK-like ATP-grasp domain [Deltaproteobacteria bacterium]|nr:RimK-like ATP-grasp domain [Deltaproteobacteria bacterium]
MIACVYGRAFAPFVETVAKDLCAAAAALGGDMRALTLESAMADPAACAVIRRLYVLPFDPPPPLTAAAVIHDIFPHAELVTSVALQDLCWDKVATQVERGVPVPDTVVSAEPADVHQFVRQHQFAVLKERYGCGGQGHIVVWFDGDDLVGDSGSHQYKIDLVPHGQRRLHGERLEYPGPFYLQRLVADIGRRVSPGQVLRAYVVDSQIIFWTERYRERYRRPADWIINVGLGAKYRFLQDLSEEAKKIAIRTAEVVGVRIAAVDIIRTGSAGPYVLEVDTDSHHMLIDRQFKAIPEYREFFNLEHYIAETVLAEPPPPWRPQR